MKLEVFGRNLKRLKKDMPKITEKLAATEGEYLVRTAKRICTESEPDVVNTGDFRNNFKKRVISGATVAVRLENNLEYASHVEYGFRSHFVPGHWEGNIFVYEKGAKTGMFVGKPGGFVRGRYVLRRTMDESAQNRSERLERKLARYVEPYLDGSGGEGE